LTCRSSVFRRDDRHEHEQRHSCRWRTVHPRADPPDGVAKAYRRRRSRKRANTTDPRYAGALLTDRYDLRRRRQDDVRATRPTRARTEQHDLLDLRPGSLPLAALDHQFRLSLRSAEMRRIRPFPSPFAKKGLHVAQRGLTAATKGQPLLLEKIYATCGEVAERDSICLRTTAPHPCPTLALAHLAP
jgi:hypothetical protein